MRIFTIPLDPRYPDCTLTAYLHEPDGQRRRAIVICPGGAYQFLSEREGEPVARAFCAAGLQAFVLAYSVGDRATGGAPLVEGALAIRHIREHAEAYGVDPRSVFMAGFSAGGHLAALCGTLWDDPAVRDALGVDRGEAPAGIGRPTATVLGYPVISASAPGWSQSIATLTGIEDYKGRPEAERYSVERHVDATTAPAFIWHTADDEGVDIRHTLLYAEALAAAGVPFEYHVYPHGPHGLSLATAETAGGNPDFERPDVAEWFGAAVRFLGQYSA